MSLTFDFCVSCLTQVAQLTGLTYKQVNVILFCGIWPAITIGLIVWVGRLYRAVNRNRHPPYIWVLRQEDRIMCVATDPKLIEKYLHTWYRQTAPDLTLWRAFNGAEYSIGATRRSLPAGFVAVAPQPTKQVDRVTAELLHFFVEQNIEEDALDDAVHDAISSGAAAINNQGVEAQIRFLIEHLGEAATRSLLEETTRLDES